MKGKIIETAGKAWKVLGEKKEVKVTDISKLVKEKGEIVFQALGWLAREDKINYISRKKQTFVSLVDPELECFRSIFPPKQKRTTVKIVVKPVVRKVKQTVKSRVKKVLKRSKK